MLYVVKEATQQALKKKWKMSRTLDVILRLLLTIFLKTSELN